MSDTIKRMAARLREAGKHRPLTPAEQKVLRLAETEPLDLPLLLPPAVEWQPLMVYERDKQFNQTLETGPDFFNDCMRLWVGNYGVPDEGAAPSDDEAYLIGGKAHTPIDDLSIHEIAHIINIGRPA